MNAGILACRSGAPPLPREMQAHQTAFPMINHQTAHPEALEWAARVEARGGRVPPGTFAAVSRFCREIDAAGLRDRFLRLNLLCGGFIGSLQPLYRNTVPSDAFLGFASDVNIHFVPTFDYTESGGLTPNQVTGGTTKYLDTGVIPDRLPTVNTGHLAVWKTAGGVGIATSFFIGNRSSGRVSRLEQAAETITPGNHLIGWWNSPINAAATSSDTTAGLVLVTRRSYTSMPLFKNVTQIGDHTAFRSQESIPTSIIVYNTRNTDNTVSAQGWFRALYSYSIGAALSDTQIVAYHAALSSFNAALGRQ